MSYLIGIDIGTSGAKTVLFSDNGSVIASYISEYPLYQPKNGWAEQNPSDWLKSTFDGIKSVLCSSGVNPADIKGIGLSGQMHGLVMLDKNYQVIRPSIIWCDVRTAEECEQITNTIGKERLVDITANPALPGFTASKILWVRNNEPENYEKCRYILLPKDYIRFKLTGELASDMSDASGMQLMDVKNRCWSQEVISKLKLDASMLPKLFESPEIAGRITRDAAEITGLKEGTIVVAGAGDNAAAAVGTGIVRDGTAFTTIGTSGVVFAHTSKMTIDKSGRIHTFCHAVPGAWHVMGVTQGAGLSLKWFKDNFCTSEIEASDLMNVSPYYLTDKEAQKSPIGANRLIYLPYLMGERTPHLDPDARGVFFGLSAIHKKRDLIRAVMEGVAFSLLDALNVIKETGINIDRMSLCGGGGTSPMWRQIICDVFNCPVNTIASGEGPALGAALLSAVGSGIYKNVQEAVDATIKYDSMYYPSKEAINEYLKYYKVYQGLYPALKDSYKALSKLSYPIAPPLEFTDYT